MTSASPKMTLRRITIENFRAFEQPVQLNDLERLNLIAGPNNIGKSSLLMPLRRLTRLDLRFVPRRGTPDGGAFFGPNHHAFFRPGDLRAGSVQPRVLLEVEIPNMSELGAKFFATDATAPPMSTVPCPTRIELELKGETRHSMNIEFSEKSRDEIAVFYRGFPSGSVRRLERDDLRRIALELTTSLASRTIYVPNHRRVVGSFARGDESEHEERRYDGESLLPDLLSWYLPDRDTGMSAHPDKVTALNERLSEIFRARVRIWPTATQELLVAINDDPPRGLDDLGQGVTQIMTIVAAMLSMPDDPVLLLEEPENCLHPGLQRQLVDHLALQPGQVFITTHSNHLIDASVDRSRLHLITYNPATNARTAVAMDRGFLQTVQELGVVASSIAAAAAVLWVEGPSDAIYLRHWLRRHSRGAMLTEGRDFTFAFHGGALLAHVGLDDEAVKLFALHPGFYLVADSDRLEAGAGPAHPYLQRLVNDDRLRDRLWVTKPKEVEGYLPDSALTDEVPTGVQTTGYEPLDRRLASLGLPESRREHKVPFAQRAVKKLANMSIEEVFVTHDLLTQVDRLVAFIEGCRRILPPIVS